MKLFWMTRENNRIKNIGFADLDTSYLDDADDYMP